MHYGTVHNTTFDIKKKISAKPKIIFRDSDRFFRGKIIDALRSGSMNERKLCDDFKHTYAKPDSFTRNLVRSLMKEGMVAKRGARIFLPE